MAWNPNETITLGQQAFDPDKLWAEYHASQPKKQEKGNFFTDLIPTGGGIGGALGGAAIGAGIGSAVPVIGTAIGGLAGGVIGGALGSGGGKVAENAVEGNQNLFEGVPQEAALGGVFSAPPLRLARGLGEGLLQGGKALARQEGAQVAGQAAKQSLESALTRPGIISRTGQKLGGAADNLAVKQFRLTPSQLTNFQKKFSEDAGQTIRRYGFNTAEDVTSKGIEPLQQQFGDAISGIPGVTKQSLRQNFDSKISTLTKSASSDNKALGKQLKQEANSVLKRFGDVIDANELNQIRREFDSLVNYTQQVANPARYGVNKRIADAIRETLQKSDPSGQLKNIGSEISKLKQLADNVAKQDNLGRGSSPLGLINLLGATGGGVLGGVPGAAGMYAATRAVNSKAGRRAAMGAADRLSKTASNSAERQVGGVLPAGLSGRGIAGRLGIAGLVSGAVDQVSQPQTLEGALSQSLDVNSNNQNITPSMNIPMNTSNASNIGSSYQNQGEMSSPYGRENLLYDIQRDPANAQAYIQQFQQLQEVLGQPAQPEYSSAIAGTISDLQSSLNELGKLQQTIQSGQGGTTGPIFGTLRALNPYDTQQQTLQAAIDKTRQIVGKALEGGVLRKEDEEKYKKILPTVGDTHDVAMAKINAVQSQLTSKLQDYQHLVGAGNGTSLEDILTQGAF